MTDSESLQSRLGAVIRGAAAKVPYFGKQMDPEKAEALMYPETSVADPGPEQKLPEQRYPPTCYCTWDPGGYYEPPTPKEICELCIGGMNERQRINYALNVYRRDRPETADAVRDAMQAAGLSAYTLEGALYV